MHTAKIFWLTGLSGAGKTTIANALHARLQGEGQSACLLDGDVLRTGLCRDLGFSEEDRMENMRRTGEVARLFHLAGVCVVAAFISPLQRGRELVRSFLPPQAFMEIYVSTPLEECERRDPKGLYKKVRQGLVPHFTGISAPYDVPVHPEVTLDTLALNVEQCVDTILHHAYQSDPCEKQRA